ncbi:hypothetical protein [Lyngbya confervoides]|uniref:Uncharacterized protein n=1 Tax=Lyngbya confervoides BDU141951 TaxID=1574623 RepID=A0ABD4T6Y8_9CYAN|nr:hypothetical protein [Lyngbya confervoides]MCM1984214.1 hypothetical protein [Lyngbya confervoides BDU141951]
MKLLTRTALALVIAMGTCFPALAGSSANSTIPGNEISGEVESVEGTTLTVKTADGSTQHYLVDPALPSALGLEAGSKISISGKDLRRGVITGVDDNTIKVKHDNGDVMTYIINRESRTYLSYGDRVIVNARGDVVREDWYKLTANEVARVYDYSIATRITQSVATTPPVVTPAPTYTPPAGPVPAMW